MQFKKQQLGQDMEEWTGSKMGKEYVKVVYCYLAYLTSLQSSVQFSCSVVSDSLRPHRLQHGSLPCPSPNQELTQTHVHWVGDAIQPPHPLLSPSPFTFNPSQHQGLFQWVSSSHQVAKELEFQLWHQSFQWIFRIDFLENWLLGFPCSPRDPQESSPTP